MATCSAVLSTSSEFDGVGTFDVGWWDDEAYHIWTITMRVYYK